MTNTLNKIMHDGDEYLLPEGFSPDNAGTTGQVLTKTANGYEYANAPVTSVNGSTGAVTVSEFNATNGGVKVFTYPMSGSVEDIVTWYNGGGSVILRKSDGDYRVTKIGTNYIESTRDSSGDGGTLNSTGEVKTDLIGFNSTTYAITDTNSTSTYSHFRPSGTATTGYVLTKTANGYEWSAPSGGDVVVSSQTGNILQSGMKIWAGLETDYQNLGTYDSNCLYLTIE